jgi:hypothetical protein
MVNEFLTYGVILDPLITVYLQFVISPIELQKVLSQEIKCLSSKTTTVLSDRTAPEAKDVSPCIFVVLYTNICILYVMVNFRSSSPCNSPRRLRGGVEV